jgi:hypothetical protein
VLRRVEPEILDHLPTDDPEAIRSRRELRFINGLMGNHRWLARQLRKHRQPGWRILELGAGDGTLGARLIREKICEPAELHALDLASRPATWPTEAAWHQHDLFAKPLPPAEIVIANLFLHHFEPAELRRLGALLPRECRVFLASEPARRRLHLIQGRLLAAVTRFGRVTRHDMPISIHAGFLGYELPALLGLTAWEDETSTTFFGAYRLTATR